MIRIKIKDEIKTKRTVAADEHRTINVGILLVAICGMYRRFQEKA